MTQEYPTWLKRLQGVCVCFNNLDEIVPQCEYSCSYQSLRNIVTSTKKPTKVALIKALVFTGSYNFYDVSYLLNTIYGPLRPVIISNRILITLQGLKEGGYLVKKDSKGCYVATKKPTTNQTEGICSK
jgi:hypothetical protein